MQQHKHRRVMPCFAITLLACLAVSAALSAEESSPVFVTASKPVFAHPHDLTLDATGTYLYVADMRNHTVKVLSPRSLDSVAEIGKGLLRYPHDVAFDRLGRLLVADSGNDRIAIFRIDGIRGEYVGELRDGLDSPEGMVADDEGRVFVSNAGNDSIVVFQHGRRIATKGRGGGASGQFRAPHDIELGSYGVLYLADPGNDRVQLLSMALHVVGIIGGREFGFDQPKYLSIDPQDRLYVADQHNHQIKIFDAARKRIYAIGSGKRGDGDNELDRPEGVETDGVHIWVSDTYNNRVLLYRWPDA